MKYVLLINLHMLNKIKKYLSDNNWKFSTPENDKSLIFFGLITDNGKFQCVIDVNEKDKKIIFYSVYPFYVPNSLKSSLAEILTRINHNLFLGNFELDFDDGEIRFKTSVIYEDTKVTTKMIDHLIRANIFSLDTNFETIDSFINGKITKHQVIRNIRYSHNKSVENVS